MSEENEGQEKSFEASETKIRKSREKGDIAQSKEATTFLLYLGFVVTIFAAGQGPARSLLSSLSSLLTHPDDIGRALLFGSQDFMMNFVTGIGLAIAALMVIPFVFVLLSLVVQRAIVFAPEKIVPKLSRISPVSLAKQKYGPDGLMEFFKTFLKMSFIALIGTLYIYLSFMSLSGLSGGHANDLTHLLKHHALSLTLWVMVPSALITLIDLPYVHFSHLKKLRMTFQEMRDEHKENEGDPHMKSARRARAEAISQQTMMRDLEGADVVIVNPTHYAVALRWDRESKQVPVCVAKGVDSVAFRIREKAKLCHIPIHSDPPSARALHASVEIGQPIKPEHYAAVAAAIHFADSVRKGQGFDN